MSGARLAIANPEARAAERELEAWEPLLRRIAGSYRVPGMEHEEVVQVLRIAVWEGMAAYDGSTPRRAFAALLARRRLITELIAANRGKRRLERSALRVVTLEGGAQLAAAELAPEPISLEHRVEVRAQLRALVAGLEGLTPLERQGIRALANGDHYSARGPSASKSTDNAAQRGKAKIRRALAAHDAA